MASKQRLAGGGIVRILNYIFFIAVSLVSIASVASAQTSQLYFSFTVDSRNEVQTLTKLISIDNVVGDTVYAFATDAQFERFTKLGYSYTVLPNPASLITPRMSGTIDEILEWDSYPTYGAYVDMMYQFQTDYPQLCRIENIGQTVNGRDLLFAEISANVEVEENEPEVMYSSSMHGNETTGYILTLRLIDYLLSNYGVDPEVTAMVDTLEIWINPLANPDGTYHGGDNSVSGAIRYNANWVDLNRNFPDPDEGSHPDGNPYQPETLAMMHFFEQHTFTISANFHGGAEVVNYPWDTWPRRHADDPWLIQISREYADSAQANSPSGYMTDLNDGITNGWDWYTIAGGRQDYLTYYKGDREITIELSHTYLPPGNQLPAFWNYNRSALLTYLQQALYGIRGLVTDYYTGQPVAATVTVLNHDLDNSMVYTDPDIGDYHRMIHAGTWDLRISAAGYDPQTVYGISVGDYSSTVLDIQLMPITDPVPTLSDWGMIIFGLLMAASITAFAIRRRSTIKSSDALPVD